MWETKVVLPDQIGKHHKKPGNLSREYSRSLTSRAMEAESSLETNQ